MSSVPTTGHPPIRMTRENTAGSYWDTSAGKADQASRPVFSGSLTPPSVSGGSSPSRDTQVFGTVGTNGVRVGVSRKIG